MPLRTPSDSAGRTHRSSSASPKRKSPKPRRAKGAGRSSRKKEILSRPIRELEERLGHHFSDLRLILQALTHRSFSQEAIPLEADNERLEFLGDAVLQLIVTMRLWTEPKEEDEGVLTRRRSERVSGRALARVAREMDLAACLRLGKGELKTGGRQKPSIMADALEAVVGAIYLDAGFAQCAEVVESWLWKGADDNLADVLAEDYKSQLQQELQRLGKRLPAYRVKSESGPEHNKIFKVEVRHGGQVLGIGFGKSKKEAEQVAAQESIAALVREKKGPP
ncbi:MAG: ribonuclease III [Nitrospinota bacterium]|nr:ribonuclease III [Nitrospinota bacterium]